MRIQYSLESISSTKTSVARHSFFCFLPSVVCSLLDIPKPLVLRFLFFKFQRVTQPSKTRFMVQEMVEVYPMTEWRPVVRPELRVRIQVNLSISVCTQALSPLWDQGSDFC